MTEDAFVVVNHTVYHGRDRLGRYAQSAPACYEAFDASDVALGTFSNQKLACAAISGAHRKVRE